MHAQILRRGQPPVRLIPVAASVSLMLLGLSTLAPHPWLHLPL
jgi:hypothetical protein